MREVKSNKKSFQITRTPLTARETISQVQNCFDRSQSSLIPKAVRLSLRNFIRKPLYRIFSMLITALISLGVNLFLQPKLSSTSSFLLSAIFCAAIFVASVYFRCYFGWKSFIKTTLSTSDLSYKWAENVYSKENNAFFVASSENTVIATSGILIEEDKNIFREPLCPRLDDQREALITRVGVLPEFQGKGAGRAVVQACIDFAKSKNVKVVKLVTTSSQEAAISLYKSLGFKITKVEEFVPMFDFHKFLMVLVLE